MRLPNRRNRPSAGSVHRRRRWTGALLSLGLLAGAVATQAPSRADETTVSQDDFRSGWDPNEPGLTPGDVSSSDFGQMFSTQLAGQFYAQPLVVGNTLIVANENDDVYGLDATTGATLWHDNYGLPWVPPQSVNGLACNDISPNIGITSTPVYDASSGTGYLYFTTKVATDPSNNTNGGPAKILLHAVTLDGKSERPGFPVAIGGTPSNEPNAVFDAAHEGQRPGLIVVNGWVYLAFGSVCDWLPYRGYVAGVSLDGAKQTLWTTYLGAGGSGGGIWGAGAGIAADAQGHLFVATGNGYVPGTLNQAAPGSSAGTLQLGQSVIRLNVNTDANNNVTLTAADFFSPANADVLNNNDQDVGSGSPLLLPDQYFGTSTVPHLAVQEGKEGTIYLVNRDNLGGRAQGPNGTDQIVQNVGNGGGCYCSAAAWPGDGGYVYYTSQRLPLTAYKYGLDGSGSPKLAPVATAGPASGYLTEGNPVVTSNGAASGSAVVWVSNNTNFQTGAGSTLTAYNALPNADGTMTQLWQATQDDSLGMNSLPKLTKFNRPATSHNRIYVAGIDGKVNAYGRPAATPITGSQLSIGSVNVGGTGTGTMTITAAKALTISAITTTAPFGIGPNAPALPVTLAAGATLAIPVSFSPTLGGPFGGIVKIASDQGTVGISVTGKGLKPGLAPNPAALAFDEQPTTLPLTKTVVFTNTGSAAETVSATTTPGTPYTVSGLPPAGAAIAPNTSVTVSVTYRPTAAGTNDGSLSITSTSGTVTVPIDGTAIQGQGNLVVTPSPLAFGPVAVGHAALLNLTVQNTGNIPLSLPKAKPPSGDLTAVNPVPEGTTIPPGQQLTITIQFAPTTATSETALYVLTPDTGQGEQDIELTGTGTVSIPAPSTTSWTANGAAAINADGSIQLTPAAQYLAGSAWYDTALPTEGLQATFTAQIGGGTGADGLTFALLDSTKAAVHAVGSAGGGLGFSSLPGVDVTLDTYFNAATNSSNYIGVAAGPGDGGWDQTYSSSVNAPSNLRTGTHTIGITVTGGHIKVSFDGAQVLDAVPAAGVIPATAFVGFTGATGYLTDAHTVSGVAIAQQAPTAPGLNATPSPLAFGNVPTNHPATASVVLANRTSAAEVVSATAPPSNSSFTATLPAVGTTIAPGASVTVPVTFAPTGTGAQNSVFSVTSTSGTAAVSLTGYGLPPTTAALPGFGDPSWTANGSGTISGSGSAALATLTTDPTLYSAGDVVDTTAVNPIGLTAQFTTTTSGTSSANGADGICFALLDASSSTKNSLGQWGAGLGVGGLNSVFVTLDEYGTMGLWGESVDIGTTTSAGTTVQKVATAQPIPVTLRNGGPHTVNVTITGASHMVVTIDGTQVLDASVSLPPRVLVAFTAGTGASSDTHVVANPVVQYLS